MRGPRDALRFWPALLLSIPLGCSSPSPLVLPIPIEAGTKAVILAYENTSLASETSLDSLLAIDPAVDPPPGLLPLISRTKKEQLPRFTALLYSQTLDELGLAAGKLTLVPTDVLTPPPSRPLPSKPPPKVKQADLVDVDVLPVWVDQSALSPSLAALRIPPPVRCVNFSVQQWVLPQRASPGFAAWIDSAGVFLAGTKTGTVFVIDPSTHGGTIDSFVDDGFFQPSAMWMAPNGDLWLGSYFGSIAQARLTHDSSGYRFQMVKVLTSTLTSGPGDAMCGAPPNVIDAIDGGLDPSGAVEIFAGTRTGTLLHYDATSDQLAVLTTIPTEESRGLKISCSEQTISIAWVAPGEAVVLPHNLTVPYRYRAGVLSEEPITGVDPPPGQLTVIERLGAGKIGAATVTGALLINDGHGWQSLGQVPEQATQPQIFVPYQDGYFYGGFSGIVGQWSSLVGYCPAAALATNEVTQLAVSKNGSIFLGAIYRDLTAGLTLSVATPVSSTALGD